ncbi:MAG: GTPase HflX, partial [Oligoflexales bacterium]|nr:GTPase HflX [Oligoflexales bacterium]
MPQPIHSVSRIQRKDRLEPKRTGEFEALVDRPTQNQVKNHEKYGREEKIKPPRSSAIIVGVQMPDSPLTEVQEGLDELSALLSTLGVQTLSRVIQKRHKLSPSLLIGEGKIQEIKQMACDAGASCIVIDHILTGVQHRNLEQLTGCEVLERSQVILDIFSKHARTNQAKTQVEIAQLEYMMPRLVKAWTHFHRQAGGGVHSRGMGETQIEIDRRRARDRIHRLQKKLEQIRKEKQTQRKSRQNELKVSLVGYTNSGKTTLMNALTHCSAQGHSNLFATLDTTVRTLDPNTRPVILMSDTVGFIKKLPHSLIESFKTTLEEAVQANLLLHVIDVSHENYKQQMEATDLVLEEIGVSHTPRLLIFNKMDQLDEPFLESILQKKYPGSLAISARKPEDILRLRAHVLRFFDDQFAKMELLIPGLAKEQLSLVYANCLVLREEYQEDGSVALFVKGPKPILSKLTAYQAM